MKIYWTTLVAITTIAATSAYGQAVDQCLELLRLSRTSFQTVISERQFQDAKLHFCSEYRRSRQDGKSANYAGSLDLLSSSMGRSSRTEDNVASKYCRFEADERALEGSYEEYINGIEPGAYGAYQACIDARKEGVQVSVLGAITQDRLELRVEHATSIGTESAELTWSSSAPVNCLVDREGEESGSRQFTLEVNERVVLACSRDDPRTNPVLQPDYVNVVRNNGRASVSVAWPKYNDDGVPYQTLREIRQQLDTELATLRDEINDKINDSQESLKTLSGELGELIRECRVCFREVEGSSQCQGNRNTCSGWSTPQKAGDWTKPFRDDTDRRSGGCRYQWRLECR